jgi:hypothetical protein
MKDSQLGLKEALVVRISEKPWDKNCYKFFCKVFTLSVVNI